MNGSVLLQARLPGLNCCSWILDSTEGHLISFYFFLKDKKKPEVPSIDFRWI